LKQAVKAPQWHKNFFQYLENEAISVIWFIDLFYGKEYQNWKRQRHLIFLSASEHRYPDYVNCFALNDFSPKMIKINVIS